MNQIKKQWGFADIWNSALVKRNERELIKRENLWASELGKAPVDIWLKMNAVKLTNPPNPRSLRKFEAGNVFEWIISLILKRAGILKAQQQWVSHQYEGLLKVTGKADFIAGGKPNVGLWETEMNQLSLPDVFYRAGRKTIEYFEKNYPDGLEEMPLEIKSVSAFMFEALERKQSSSKIHRIQAYHYLKSANYPKAKIIYVCRDDLRIMEYLIDSSVESEYREAIEKISQPFLKQERPPLEKPIVFDSDIGKFCKNFNVAYSGYLTMLYGFKDQKEFDEKYTPIVSKWNRVMSRIKEKKEMTGKNNEVLDEIKAEGFNLEDIKNNFIESQLNENEEN